MKCEICKQNEATVHFKQVSNGAVKEMYVCKECAAENGFDVQSPMALTDFLFGVGMPQPVDSEGDDKACPSCRLKRSEYRKNSRLGCEWCYETFVDELSPLITAMHKGSRHVGKVPAAERVSAEIAALQQAMQRAVAAEDFEEAARLRDRIKDLMPAQQE
jgi:protein arginine kinase activator